MKNLVNIEKFREGLYEVNIDGLKRSCPLYKAGADMWIVGNEHLSFGTDVEFTHKVGKLLAEKLGRFEFDFLMTAEAKSLCVAYEVARNLRHKDFAIARKSIKPYTENYISEKINSITSAKNEILCLDNFNMNRIKNKKIILLDDVISTGSTMLGLLRLAKSSRAKVSAIAAIWLEGPWPFEQFSKEFESGNLIFLDILPIFARGSVYDQLYEKKILIETTQKTNT
jgi:adenine phosphoribosyltransferase